MDVLSLVTTERPFFTQQQEAIAARGVDVTTVSVPGDWQPGETGRSVDDYVAFYRAVLAERPWEYDLLHANYGLTAPAALAAPGAPVVLSLWGSDLFGTFGRVSRACARLCDAVVVMSEEMAAALDRDCYVVPHGVDFDLFAPRDASAARVELDWDERAHQVLFPYAPEREVKNYPLAERVVERVDEGLERDVRLQVVSGVAHDRIPTYMNAADAMLLTSTDEGSPNAVREAMACNLPVVSVDVGDVAERVDGAGLSTVCETEDGLATALEGVLTTSERPNERTAVSDESLDRTGERLCRIFRTVVSDRPPTAATETVAADAELGGD